MFISSFGKKTNTWQRPHRQGGALGQFRRLVLLRNPILLPGNELGPMYWQENQILPPVPRADTGLQGAAQIRCCPSHPPSPGEHVLLVLLPYDRGCLCKTVDFWGANTPVQQPGVRGGSRTPAARGTHRGAGASGRLLTRAGPDLPPPVSRPLRPAAGGPRRPGTSPGAQGRAAGAARPHGCRDRTVPGCGCVPGAGRDVLCGGATWGETHSLRRRGRRHQQLLTGRVYRRRRCHLVSEKN